MTIKHERIRRQELLNKYRDALAWMCYQRDNPNSRHVTQWNNLDQTDKNEYLEIADRLANI